MDILNDSFRYPASSSRPNRSAGFSSTSASELIALNGACRSRTSVPAKPPPGAAGTRCGSWRQQRLPDSPAENLGQCIEQYIRRRTRLPVTRELHPAATSPMRRRPVPAAVAPRPRSERECPGRQRALSGRGRAPVYQARECLIQPVHQVAHGRTGSRATSNGLITTQSGSGAVEGSARLAAARTCGCLKRPR